MTRARDLADSAQKANFLDNVTSDVNTSLTDNATAAANAVLPAGLILPFGNSSAPTGFLACEGQVLVRADYLTLFTAIGVTWNTGGETGAQFRLPDLRGAFLRGTGSHGTSNMANGNDYAGPSVGSFENDQFQEHSHNIVYRNDSGGNEYGAYTSIDGTNYGTCPDERYLNHSYGQSNRQGGSCAYRNRIIAKSTGGDETRPFNAGILYCIKT